MKYLPTSVSIAACLLFAPLAATAQEVTISSKDNTIQIMGRLVDFNDEVFVVDTEIGQLRLSRDATNCEGEGCPTDTTNMEMVVAVTEPKTAKLLQGLIGGYGQTRGFIGLSVPDANGVVTSIGLLNRSDNSPAGNVDVSVANASTAFDQLVGGSANLTLTKSAVPASVAENYAGASGVDLRDIAQERVVALDALVPVVHPENPVRSISLEELALIASGRLRNWSELGGDNTPIRMLLPAEGTSLDQSFAELVLEPQRVRLRRSAERAESETQAAEIVAQDEAAITITSLSETGQGTALPIRQTCGPLAYATDFAIKAEEYPLSRRVFAYTSGRSLSAAESGFSDFIASAEAQPLIQNAGYVDQTVVPEPISLQGTRMTSAILSADNSATLGLVQNFSRDLATADRLSTTFRFTSGSSQLDSKSVVDIQRMVDFLNSPVARNRDVLIIGFTDDVGRFDLNERLALLRATNVRDALITAVGGDVLADRMAVSSYGPLAPVGCNETADGRESNRRVEIWLR